MEQNRDFNNGVTYIWSIDSQQKCKGNSGEKGQSSTSGAEKKIDIYLKKK